MSPPRSQSQEAGPLFSLAAAVPGEEQACCVCHLEAVTPENRLVRCEKCSHGKSSSDSLRVVVVSSSPQRRRRAWFSESPALLTFLPSLPCSLSPGMPPSQSAQRWLLDVQTVCLRCGNQGECWPVGIPTLPSLCCCCCCAPAGPTRALLPFLPACLTLQHCPARVLCSTLGSTLPWGEQ